MKRYVLALTLLSSILSAWGNKCPRPESIEHGSYQKVEYSGWPGYICHVMYSCDAGFLLNGTSHMYCYQETWIGSTPLCQAVSCSALDTPDNGAMSYIDNGVPNNQLDSIVEFNCNDGYELVGMMSLVCLKNQNWSAQTPNCVSTKCDDFTDETTTALPVTTAAPLTTAAETTAPAQSCDGLQHGAKCLIYVPSPSKITYQQAVEDCQGRGNGAQIARVDTPELLQAVKDYVRGFIPEKENGLNSDVYTWIEGTYDPASHPGRRVTWMDGSTQILPTSVWYPTYPSIVSVRTHLIIRVFRMPNNYDGLEGIQNMWPTFAGGYALCEV